VRYGSLAANGHSTQPWRFVRTPDGIAIEPDFTRRAPIVDPDEHHIFASIGCAVENILVAAPSLARASTLALDIRAERMKLALDRTAAEPDPLAGAIPRRQCTRSIYDGRAIPLEQLNLLEQSARMQGVETRILTARVDIDAVRDFVIEGNRAQMADATLVRELKQWIRFNPEAAVATGDGLFAATSGSSTLPSWLGPTMFDMAFTEDAEAQRYAEQMRSSAGVAIFVGAENNPAHWLQAGRAYQRFALQATALAIKNACVNQPGEVRAIRGQFGSHFSLGGRRPDLIMRFGAAPDRPSSLQRPVSEVLAA
jgi:hypothetical protein